MSGMTSATTGDDSRMGGEGADVLEGLAGNDTLSGQGGSDTLDGGLGSDLLDGGDGQDRLWGGAGAQLATPPTDTLRGGAGDDTLVGDNPRSTYDGGAGTDTLFLQGAMVLGDLDRLVGIEIIDIDKINLNAGLGGGVGAFTNIFGTSASNVFDFRPYGILSSALGAGNWGIGVDALGGADTVFGTGGDDYLDGNTGNNSLVGGDGHDLIIAQVGSDTLLGGAGSDTLHGSAGEDVLDGGEGNDRLSLDEETRLTEGANRVDTLRGGAGDDTLRAGDSDHGVAIYDGGVGIDTLRFETGGAIWNLRDMSRLVGIEIIEGGVDGTAFFGSGESDALDFSSYAVMRNGSTVAPGGGTHGVLSHGLAGSDTIIGGSGEDTLSNHGGNSRLVGGGGRDVLSGGEGSDTLVGGAGNDVLYGNSEPTYDDGSDASAVDVAQFALASHEVLREWIPDYQFSGIGAWKFTSDLGVDHLFGIERAHFTDGILDLATGVLTTPPVARSVSIAAVDIARAEGQPGNTADFFFAVTRTRFDAVERVGWVVEGLGGQPADAADFGGELPSGVIEFALGEINQGVLVNVIGDSLSETDERFTVRLISPSNGLAIGTASATGVILNDDPAAPQGLRLEGDTGADSLLGGAASDTLVGGAGADTLDGGAGADSLAGGNNDDVYIIDDPDDVVVELASGKTDTVRTTLASFTLMENVETLVFTGIGAFAGTGNAGRNTITGGSGADTLDGREGADTMTGGGGDDLYIVDSTTDRVVERADGGLDTVRTALSSHTLANHVEALVFTGTQAFTGTGNAGANAITGGGAADRLTGNVGDDTLDGAAGADRLIGGTGHDVYVVDDVRDVVVEGRNAGTDTVRTTLSAFTLRPEVETLTYLGAAAFAGTGNAAANDICGGNGADTLDGDKGADTLAGGAGNDTYVVDTAADVVIEAGGGGTDTVRTTLATYTLPTEVEALTFTGKGSFVGTGNAAANVITGGIGADSLSGEAGADTMIGGAGDDGYLVDHAGDVIVEAAGAGIDAVASLGSYTLGAEIESLRLLAPGRGTGNAIANRMMGSDGADTLEGLDGADTLDGGLGADRLVGGAGDDLYLVDDAADTVREVAEGGLDTVRTTLASLTLANDVEHLVFVGAGPFTGIGNDGANSITGQASDDTLVGDSGADTLDGGAGADSLAGGRGDDVYVVDAPGDRVQEARNAGTDTVRTTLTSFVLAAEVENVSFTGVGAFRGEGNATLNLLTGGSAGDTLDGGTGADTLVGGGGSDLYVVDHAGDLVVEAAGGGADSVVASVSYTLGAEIEVLTLTARGQGTGNALGNTILGSVFGDTLSGLSGIDVLEGDAGDDSLRGDAGDDRLSGGDGADTLDGGAGADRMVGGLGDDLYLVDAAGDVISEAGAGGLDRVRASVSYVLAAGLEVLQLTGAARDGTGNDGDNVLLGTRSDNLLAGLRGADSLLGDLGADTLLGDIGADTLDGGRGSLDRLLGGANDDTYVIEDLLDVIVERAGEGNKDHVLATVSITLAAEVELLTLLGTANLSGTGNASDNLLAGNGGRNLLSGLAGADTLNGGGGADTLRGDDGNDVLDGGAGADTLVGGAGNDTFVIGPDSGADLIVDYGQGRDFLRLMGTGLWTVAEVMDNVRLLETGLFALDFGGPLLGVNVVSFAGFASVEAVRDALIVRFGSGAEVVAVGETYAADEDSILVVGAAQGLLANDSGADGGLAIARAGQSTTAQGGVVTIAADGSFEYYSTTPNFFGTDRFSYLVRDADGSVAEATATINVAPSTDGLDLLGLAAFDVMSDGTVSFAVLATRGDATAATLKTTWSDHSGIEVDTLPLPAFVPGDAVLPYAFSHRFTEPGVFGVEVELLDSGRHTLSNGFFTRIAGDSAAVLAGEAGIDVLIGSAGADTLIGDAGSDALYGGAGSDLFLFTDADFGTDYVYARFGGDNQIDDFQVGVDKISLSGLGEDLDSFADVLARARNVSSILGGTGVAIAWDDRPPGVDDSTSGQFSYVTIFLKDVSKAELVESDFVFG